LNRGGHFVAGLPTRFFYSSWGIRGEGVWHTHSLGKAPEEVLPTASVMTGSGYGRRYKALQLGRQSSL